MKYGTRFSRLAIPPGKQKRRIRDVAVPMDSPTIVEVGADFVRFATFAGDVLAMRYGF